MALTDTAFSLGWDEDLQNDFLQLLGEAGLFTDLLLERILELHQAGWFDLWIHDEALRTRFEGIEERSPFHRQAMA